MVQNSTLTFITHHSPFPATSPEGDVAGMEFEAATVVHIPAVVRAFHCNLLPALRDGQQDFHSNPGYFSAVVHE